MLIETTTFELDDRTVCLITEYEDYEYDDGELIWASDGVTTVTEGDTIIDLDPIELFEDWDEVSVTYNFE